MDSTAKTTVDSTGAPPRATRFRFGVGRRHTGALVARFVGVVVSLALAMTLFQAGPASAQTVGYGDIFTDSHVAWNVAESSSKNVSNGYGICQMSATLHWSSTNSSVNGHIEAARSRLKPGSGRSGMLVRPGVATITWIVQTTHSNDVCPTINGHNGNLSAWPTWARDWLAEAVYLVISLGVTAGLMGLAAVFTPALLANPWFDGAIGCMAGALGNTAYLLVLGQKQWTEVLSGIVSGCIAGGIEVAAIGAIGRWAGRIAAPIERQVANQGILNSGEINTIMNEWLVEMVNL